MNINCLIWILACTSVVSLPLTADEKGRRAGTWLSNWGDFDPAELRALADKPAGKRDHRKLMELILYAGVKKDESFQDLLKREGLREATNVDLALSAYDYMMNKSKPALNRILAQLATEDVGADVDTTLVLAFIDEWNWTIRAFRKHFIRTDGAGSTNKYFFKSTRAYLYPKKYEEMSTAIEAPIEWSAPLLPQEE